MLRVTTPSRRPVHGANQLICEMLPIYFPSHIHKRHSQQTMSQIEQVVDE